MTIGDVNGPRVSGLGVWRAGKQPVIQLSCVIRQAWL